MKWKAKLKEIKQGDAANTLFLSSLYVVIKRKLSLVNKVCTSVSIPTLTSIASTIIDTYGFCLQL